MHCGVAGHGPVTMCIDGHQANHPQVRDFGRLDAHAWRYDDYRQSPLAYREYAWVIRSQCPSYETKDHHQDKRTVYAAKLVDKKMVVVTQDGAAGFDLPTNIEQTEDDAIEMFKKECHKYLVILGLADSINLRITKGR